jgi:hypothetical protein
MAALILGGLGKRVAAEEPDSRAAMDKLFEADGRNQMLTPESGVNWWRCATKVGELRYRPGAAKPLAAARKCVARTEALYTEGFRLIRRCNDIILSCIRTEQAAAGSEAASEHRQAQRLVRSCSAELTAFIGKLQAHQKTVNSVSQL